MELGRTENSEIIFIHTDDLEVTIKGGASGDPPPFVTPDQLESSVVFTCASEFKPSGGGRWLWVSGHLQADAPRPSPVTLCSSSRPVIHSSRRQMKDTSWSSTMKM